jgi:hypothetical protein
VEYEVLLIFSQAFTEVVKDDLLASSLHESDNASNSGINFGLKLCVGRLCAHIGQDCGLEMSETTDSSMMDENLNASSIGPLSYTLAVRDVTLEVFYNTSPSQELITRYFSLKAGDVSFYEMPVSIAELGGGIGGNCIGARTWTNLEELKANVQIPLIHRTSLESNADFGGVKMESDRTHNNNVFCMQILITEEIIPDHLKTFSPPLLKSYMSTVRNTSLHVSLRNVTYRFDPMSKWYVNLPALFDGKSYGSLAASDPQLSKLSKLDQFGVSKISVTVRKLMVDICIPDLSPPVSSQTNASKDFVPNPTHTSPMSSRLLLSIGVFTIKSTLVTNATRIGMKLSFKDVSVQIGNTLNRDNKAIEQWPLDVNGMYQEELSGYVDNQKLLDMDRFIDVHHMITMGSIDFMDSKIDLNSALPQSLVTEEPHESAAISVLCQWGVCSFFGCADSLRLLMV